MNTLGALILFAIFSMPAAAQTGTLTGTITDAESSVPLAGVSVEVLGGGGSALSNPSGQFRLSVPAGAHTVIFSNLGYRDVSYTIRVRAGATTTLDVVLTSYVFQLDGIVVTSGRKPQKATESTNTTITIGETEIADRPTATVVDHLRGTPGVDIISQGVQSTNVVIRGFNNIFSGALHVLTDYRLAGVPSLRVNLLHFVPSTDEDLERIEVVLGAGSALYGPNTSNGVLHMLTKSTLRDPKTTVYFGGGERSVFQTGIRTSHLIGENFGFKFSGQYIRGKDFEFSDPIEESFRALADSDPAAFTAEVMARGLSSETAALALERVGVRDFDFERFSGDVRADWRFAEDGTLVVQSGRTSASGIELTGLGAGQTEDWIYSYYQVRLNKGRFFTQTYLNTTDSGNSFLLRDGAPLNDKSRLFVAQIQHGFATDDGRFDLTYGLDYFHTNPRTEGTINGIYEGNDDLDEVGVYAQAEVGVTDKLKLILAGRMDKHSELDDDVFSPRVALVFSPADNQSFRASFNRGVSTPTTLNFFLDISAGRFPDPALAGLGYRLRAQGPNLGFRFQNADGSLIGMRSPFNPAALGGPGQLLPANTAVLWQLAMGVLAAQAPPSLQPLLPLLASLTPSDSDIGIMLLNLNDPLNPTPLVPGAIPDIGKLKESTSTTLELGYQGVLNNSLLIAADVWYSERRDFVSPLLLVTPLLLLNGQDIAAFIGPFVVPALMAQGLDQATAEATVGQIATTMASVPLGTVSSPGVAASGADLLVTYVNAGTVDMYGADLAIKWFVNDRWTIGASASWLTNDFFADEAFGTQHNIDVEVKDGIAPIALNAPEFKGSASIGYRDVRTGFNAEARLRFQSGFPAVSAGFVGTACLTGGQGGVGEEVCVDAYTLMDLTFGYKVPRSNATLQVTVSNLFDTGYRSFVGVPKIGRLLMARVKYDIF
ncbi:MAG: TonB-dependent receptor [Gemmatimonadetes bacterium]|nr:TonB-dependent receptor [Gemmatimonadota bacterium]